MKKLYYLSFILLILFLANSCRKEDDTVSTQTISGMVYNQCTDSGLANVQVFLKINKDNSPFQSLETTSGINGTFSFSNVDIHSNSKFTYAIYIPSKSGIGGGETGFNGTTLSFNNNESSIFFKTRVTPKFLLINVSTIYSNSVSNLNDSIVLIFSQKTFHKNIVDLPYTFGGGTYGIIGNSNYSQGNYPMGLYNIAIDKWKNGIHTNTQDSIYLGWGATKPYTVNW